MSFEDYVNAYYKGGLDISKRYGIRKDNLTTGDAMYFNVMYGASVFNQLNTKSDVFKLFRKEGWTQSGWRTLTARSAAASNIGIGEGAGFGTSDVPDLYEMEATIKEIVSPYTVSTRAAILSEADDGVKGLAAFLRAQAAEAHSFYIDQHLCADYAAVAVAGSDVNFTPLTRIVSNYAQVGARSGTAAAEVNVYNLARDNDATRQWADAYVNGAGGTSMGPILLLDMEHLYMKIAAPTTFLAQEDLANVQAFKRNYAFMTAGELICTKFASQGRITDLKSA